MKRMKRNMIYQLNSQKLVLGSVTAIISFLRGIFNDCLFFLRNIE